MVFQPSNRKMNNIKEDICSLFGKHPEVCWQNKGGFPFFAETTRSELASTCWLPEQFPVIV